MSPAERRKRGRPPKPAAPRMRRDAGGEFAQDLVASILDATELVLEQHGHAGLTTNRVADRAGVSIGSLYRYFPNKEAIAAALFDRYLALFTRVLAGALQGPVTYGELPDRIIGALLESYRTQPRIHGCLFELLSSADMHERVQQMLDGVVASIAGLLVRAGVAAGQANAVAFAFVHACNGVALGIYQRKLADPEQVARPFVAMVRDHVARLGIDQVRL